MYHATQFSKIKVFISSRIDTGGPFSILRPFLSKTLEDTGLFNVYLFEGFPGSNIEVTEDYLSYLDQSDICVFIIENGKEIPDGVLKEHQRAKELNKRCFYFFSKEISYEKTLIEEELIGSKGEKFEHADKLSEIPSKVCRALLESLSRAYLKKTDNNEIEIKKYTLDSDYFVVSPSINPKNETELIDSWPRTKNMFINYVSQTDESEMPSSVADEFCSQVVSALLGKKRRVPLPTSLILAEIEKVNNPSLADFKKTRFEAFNDFFIGQYIECEKKLSTLYYKYANDPSIPAWYLLDLLIDWRNSIREMNLLDPFAIIDSKPQEIINSRKLPFNYPYLDENSLRINEQIIDRLYDKHFDSPFITRFESLENLLSPIISSAIISFVNGSITKFYSIRGLMLNFLVSLYIQEPDHFVYFGIVQLCILSNDQERLDKVKRTFSEGTNTFTNSEILTLFNSAEFLPSEVRKFLAKVNVFSNYSMILSDGEYEHYSAIIFQEIREWAKNHHCNRQLNKRIFAALQKSVYRSNHRDLLEILNMLFNQIPTTTEDVLWTMSLISRDSNDPNIKSDVVRFYTSVMKDKETADKITRLERVTSNILVSLDKESLAYKELTDFLMTNNPTLLNEMIVILGLDKSDEKLTTVLLDYIDRLIATNEMQRKDGVNYDFGTDYMNRIINLINREASIISESLFDKLLDLAQKVIYNPNQIISEKKKAIELLIILQKAFENDPRLIKELKQVSSSRDLIMTGDFYDIGMGDYRQTMLFLLSIVDLICGHEDTFYNRLPLIAMSDEFTIISSLKLLITYLSSRTKIYENLRKQLFFLSMEKTYHSEPEIRILSVKILGKLERFKKSKMTYLRFSEMMDTDSFDIKVNILNVCKVLGKNKHTSLVLQKASIDNNYIVRKLARADLT